MKTSVKINGLFVCNLFDVYLKIQSVRMLLRYSLILIFRLRECQWEWKGNYT